MKKFVRSIAFVLLVASMLLLCACGSSSQSTTSSDGSIDRRYVGTWTGWDSYTPETADNPIAFADIGASIFLEVDDQGNASMYGTLSDGTLSEDGLHLQKAEDGDGYLVLDKDDKLFGALAYQEKGPVSWLILGMPVDGGLRCHTFYQAKDGIESDAASARSASSASSVSEESQFLAEGCQTEGAREMLLAGRLGEGWDKVPSAMQRLSFGYLVAGDNDAMWMAGAGDSDARMTREEFTEVALIMLYQLLDDIEAARQALDELSARSGSLGENGIGGAGPIKFTIDGVEYGVTVSFNMQDSVPRDYGILLYAHWE